MSDKIIIQYLENISGRMDKMAAEISDIKRDVQALDEKVNRLEARIDEVEEKLTARIDEVEERLSARIDKLEVRIDEVEERLSARIDEVEEKLTARIDKLEVRIDEVEERLSARINEVEETLNERIDLVEKALDTEIDSVYKIACENKKNIELLLIPFNDRNLYMSAEVSKISGLDERLDAVEDKVGQHSEEIRKLKTALAI